MTNTFTSKISGEYRMVVNRAGAEVHDSGWFKNIVTNIGIDAMLGNTSSESVLIMSARVGTGATAPAAGQMALDSQVGASPILQNPVGTSVSAGSPTYARTLTYTLTFAQGAAVGNITEVGVGWATTGNTLLSRALILDGAGSPTTITLTSIDQLTVYYRITITPVVTDVSGTLTLGSTGYPYTMRVLDVSSMFSALINLYGTSDGRGIGQVKATSRAFNASGSGLAAVTATSPLGTYFGTATSSTIASYSPGSFFRDSTLTFGNAEGNAVGGIGAIALNFGSFDQTKFQMYFSTPIPKQNTQILTITFRYALAR